MPSWTRSALKLAVVAQIAFVIVLRSFPAIFLLPEKNLPSILSQKQHTISGVLIYKALNTLFLLLYLIALWGGGVTVNFS